jgi:hypothetical protein
VFNYWNGQGRNSTDLCEKEYSSVAVNGEKALPEPGLQHPKTAIPDKNARHLRCNLQNDNNFTKYLDDREEKRQGNGSGGAAPVFSIALILP